MYALAYMRLGLYDRFKVSNLGCFHGYPPDLLNLEHYQVTELSPHRQ